jgi:hypothetical protein
MKYDDKLLRDISNQREKKENMGENKADVFLGSFNGFQIL